MDLLADRIPKRVVVGAIAVGIALSAAFLNAWWQRRTLGNEARARALPACAERLGGEDACREQMARYHDDCARLTFHDSRGQRSLNPGPARIDQDAYLECVVLGVDEWVAENARQRERADAERAKRYR